MAIALGRNSKWTVRPEYRERMRKMLTEGLGLKYENPAPPIDQYSLGNGMLGVVFEDAALGEQDAHKGAWLELLVEDPAATTKRIEAAGFAQLEYQDKTHTYFQSPGGPVFRLAKM